jgi:tRNA threonylcarbamoyladenosine biosynthesis protein TsaE
MWVSTSYQAQETFDLGRRLGICLPRGGLVALKGELGAGKTVFIKGIANGAAEVDPGVVQSPTFLHLNIYSGTQPFYHFDLYRLRDSDAFLSMGFDDYFFAHGVCCVEWSERIGNILPKHALLVTLTHLGGDRRRIEIPLTQASLLWAGKFPKVGD